MVATERRKLAETEEALREAREQGEALKNVLRLVERDNPRNSASSEASRPSETALPIRSRHRATSSAVGIKSLPPSGAASPRSHPSSPALPSSELPSSASTVVPTSSSADVTEEEGDKTLLAASPSEPPHESPTSLESSEPALSPTTNLHPSPSPSPSRSPTPSPGSSPLSAPGQYLYSKARPVDYFDGEESPWADAPSATSARVTS